LGWSIYQSLFGWHLWNAVFRSAFCYDTKFVLRTLIHNVCYVAYGQAFGGGTLSGFLFGWLAYGSDDLHFSCNQLRTALSYGRYPVRYMRLYLFSPLYLSTRLTKTDWMGGGLGTGWGVWVEISICLLPRFFLFGLFVHVRELWTRTGLDEMVTQADDGLSALTVRSRCSGLMD
jgi:hypothetical protein